MIRKFVKKIPTKISYFELCKYYKLNLNLIINNNLEVLKNNNFLNYKRFKIALNRKVKGGWMIHYDKKRTKNLCNNKKLNKRFYSYKELIE